MQRVENMTLGDAVVGVVGAGASAALGWLASSVTKVSKADFKELVARVANLEKDRITRDEFERDMAGLRDILSEFRREVREDLREIKTKV